MFENVSSSSLGTKRTLEGEDTPEDNNNNDNNKMPRVDESVFDESLDVLPETMVVPMEGKSSVRALVRVNRPLLSKSKPVDVLFQLDLSGSMSGNLNGLKKAVTHMAETVEAQHKHNLLFKKREGGRDVSDMHLAIGTYSDYSHFPGYNAEPDEKLSHGYRMWMPMHEFTPASAMNFGQKYLSKTTGGTNMMGMIKDSLKVLRERRNSEFNQDESHLQHLVILTDGKPNAGQSTVDLKRAIIDEIQGLSVVVHVLLLGTQVDLKLAETLSVGTSNGVIAYADKPENLTEAFDSILTPIMKSSRGFTLKVWSRGGNLRVENFGILSDTNNQAVVELDFGPKTVVGNHMGAKVILLDSSSLTTVMPYYTDNPDDPAWNSSAAKMPPALEQYLKSEKMEEEFREQVMNQVQESGFEDGATLLETLLSQHEATLPSSAARRLRAFLASLREHATRNVANELSSAARTMTATASYTSSRY